MTTPEALPALPDLDDARIAAMEHELFARIADEPRRVAASVPRRAARGRVWLGALGGAAAVVLLLAVAPGIGAVVTGGSAVNQSGSAGPSVSDGSGVALEPAPANGFASTDVATSDTARQVIASASATVRVDDIAAAIAAIGADATARGGFVESTSTDGGSPVTYDGTSTYPDPGYGSGYGSITVRVPADQLADATAALSTIGEVTASAVSQQDVTDQTIDLRARIDALQTSVDRLTALIAQAQTVADVVAVESELSSRQADLESYQQQLAYLDGQVSLSSLSVTVVPPSTPVTTNPAGFGDGLVAGWNGLVATLNGLVVAVGFLLPWIGVAAVIALVVWLIVRARRRARDRRRIVTTEAEGRE